MTYSNTDAKPIKTRFCATCEHYNTRDSFCTKLSRSRSKRSTCYAYAPRIAPTIKRVRWTVYDNATDDVLITCGTIDECCARLGVTESGFRKAVWLFRQATTDDARMRLPYYFIRQETDW